MEFFLVQLLNSLSYGLLLFMLSSGLTLIFSMMGVLNFAHASFYMLGAYFAFQLSKYLGFWPALAIAPLVVGALGALTERWGLRTVHKYGHVAELLFTFGLFYLIEEVVHLIWGRAPVDYRIPESLDFTAFTIFSTHYPAYRVFMMFVSVAMLAGLYLVLTRTRIGMIIQASLTHPDTVEALGHNVPRVFMLVFGGGCALAGLAGVIGGNAFVTEPGDGGSSGQHRFRGGRVRRHGLAERRLHRLAVLRSRPDLLRRAGLFAGRCRRAAGHAAHPGERALRRAVHHRCPDGTRAALSADGPDADLPAYRIVGHAGNVTSVTERDRWGVTEGNR